MISLYQNKNIDKIKWDNCIGNSVNSSVYVTSWFLDIVSEDWVALILDDYKAVLPLAVKSRFGIKIIYQPFFCRYLGIYSSEPVSEDIANKFLSSIPSEYKFIEINLNHSNYPSPAGYTITPRVFQTLDLSLPYEEIRDNYKGDAKRNLKKAKKEELVVMFEKITTEEMVSHFKSTKGAALKYIKEKDYQRLFNLIEYCEKAGKSITVSVEGRSGVVLAAAFFIKHHQTLYLLQASATGEAKKNGAMYLLLDAVFKEFSAKFRLFDFGGSNIKGVADFNRNFGAGDTTYMRIKKNDLPAPVRMIQKILGKN